MNARALGKPKADALAAMGNPDPSSPVLGPVILVPYLAASRGGCPKDRKSHATERFLHSSDQDGVGTLADTAAGCPHARKPEALVGDAEMTFGSCVNKFVREIFFSVEAHNLRL
jgi:hypothetical protein